MSTPLVNAQHDHHPEDEDRTNSETCNEADQRVARNGSIGVIAIVTDGKGASMYFLTCGRSLEFFNALRRKGAISWP